MRTLTKILLMTALALTVGTSASANWSLSLSQVGGTYDSSVGASAGDTLVLSIDYSASAPATLSSGIFAAISLDGNTLDVGASTESGFAAWEGGAVSANNIATGDIQENGGNAIGWEKVGPIGQFFGTPGSCVFGACTSMGTVALTLTGLGGVLDFGSTVGFAGGTNVQIGGVNEALNTSLVTLGTFSIVPVPEPTTASLLGLGLLGLSIAGRNRKN